MKVFLAGGSGAIGQRLIPALVDHGYEVTAMTRTQMKTESLRKLGATPVVADALDREATIRAVTEARPDVLIHQLTALTAVKSFKNFDKEFALTNQLRTKGTDNLVAAARSAGVGKIVAQSYGNWNYERTGSGPKGEEDPFDPNPPAKQVQSLAAIRHVEAAVLEAGGVVLRYGGFYGPGTDLSRTGMLTDMVRKRRFPIVGDGSGVWSLIHIDDAAAATIAAIERGAPGSVYNVVDDEPARVADWLPYLAEQLGAKPPRRVPVWLGRIAAGEVGVSMMTQIRGASNAKARRELGFSPRYPSYREGFRDGLGASPPTATRSTSAR